MDTGVLMDIAILASRKGYAEGEEEKMEATNVFYSCG